MILLQFIVLLGIVFDHSNAAGFQQSKSSEVNFKDGTYFLEHRGDWVHIPRTDVDQLATFCHTGVSPSLPLFWSSIEFRLTIDTDNYHLYVANNASEVMKLYEADQQSWFTSDLPWKPFHLRSSPFMDTCIGVKTEESYTMTLHVWHINFFRFVSTVIGLLLFFYAKSLCQNVAFHYGTGVVLGVCFSLIIMTYFLQRRFKFILAWWVVMYSMSFFALSSVWYNFQTFVMENHVYFIAYIVTVGALSFAVTYRMGPVENQRTLNLVKWSLQLMGLILVFLSSYHEGASLALVLALVLWSVIPKTFKTNAVTELRYRLCKPKVRLLTEQEYLDQSFAATQKALLDLRSYCSSKDCNAWSLTTKLQDPLRFAEFVQGGSHLKPEELVEHSHHDHTDEFAIAQENGVHDINESDFSEDDD